MAASKICLRHLPSGRAVTEPFGAIRLSRMKDENGIEAIVLGCTELPLLLNDEVSPVPCLDTMQIHINSIIDAILT